MDVLVNARRQGLVMYGLLQLTASVCLKIELPSVLWTVATFPVSCADQLTVARPIWKRMLWTDFSTPLSLPCSWGDCFFTTCATVLGDAEEGLCGSSARHQILSFAKTPQWPFRFHMSLYFQFSMSSWFKTASKCQTCCMKESPYLSINDNPKEK